MVQRSGWKECVQKIRIQQKYRIENNLTHYRGTMDNCEQWTQKPPSVNHATYHQIPVIKNQYDLLSKRENYEIMASESMGTREPNVKMKVETWCRGQETNTWRRNIKLQ